MSRGCKLRIVANKIAIVVMRMLAIKTSLTYSKNWEKNLKYLK